MQYFENIYFIKLNCKLADRLIMPENDKSTSIMTKENKETLLENMIAENIINTIHIT